MNDYGEHLTTETIAAYTDRRVPAEKRRRVERHLSLCRDCRSESVTVSQVVLRPRIRRRLMIGAPLGVAAALMIFGQAVDLIPGKVGETTVLRSTEREGVTHFDAVSPKNREIVASGDLRMIWRAVAQRAHYRVTITDEVGDVVWTMGTGDTAVGVPADAGLRPGQMYYWYVDALLDGARSATTGVSRFVIVP